MNGFHKILFSVIQAENKIKWKYINKNKLPPLYALLEVLNDYQMQNQVSYGDYSKNWRWHKRDVKEFLEHLGLKIDTSKNQYKKSILKNAKPIKKTKFPEEYFNYINKIQNGTPNGTALEHQMEQHSQIKSNSCKKSGRPNGTALEHQMANNKIEYIIEENRNNITLSNDKVIYMSLFEKFWAKYRQFMKENPHLAVNLDRKKDAELIFKRLFQKIDIISLLEKYFFKCKSLNQKVKAPKRFLKTLEDAGFREDLEKFDPLSCVDIRQCEIYFDPASNNGSGKGKLIFVYEGQALSSEQVKSSINFTFPKNAAYHLKLFAEFRQYLLNVYDFKSKRKVNQYYQNFLNEIKDRR